MILITLRARRCLTLSSWMCFKTLKAPVLIFEGFIPVFYTLCHLVIVVAAPHVLVIHWHGFWSRDNNTWTLIHCSFTSCNFTGAKLSIYAGAYILPQTWKDSPPWLEKIPHSDMSFFFISFVSTWKTSPPKFSTWKNPPLPPWGKNPTPGLLIWLVIY